MRIIGIAGTDGSGKDSLGHLLRDEFGWHFLSVTDLLREEAKIRGMELSRGTLKMISAEWRAKEGLGVLINHAVKEYERLKPQYKGLCLASLRNPGEADRVHALGGKVVWLDAPIKLRYQRALVRNKGTEDQVTFEEFQTEEAEQMHGPGDETALNLSAVKAKADIFISNDSNDFIEFKKRSRQALAGYLKA
jgi:dephospho-CoA kinase